MENLADLLGFALLIFSLLACSSVVSSSLWRRLERQLSTLAGASALLQGASVLSKKNLARPGAIAIAAAPPTNWQPVQRIGSIPSMDL